MDNTLSFHDLKKLNAEIKVLCDQEKASILKERESVKICSNCKYYDQEVCRNDYVGDLNIVTGKIDHKFCEEARDTWKYGKCGREGKFFEPKETEPLKISKPIEQIKTKKSWFSRSWFK